MKTLTSHGLLLFFCLVFAFAVIPKSGSGWIALGIILFLAAEVLVRYFKRK